VSRGVHHVDGGEDEEEFCCNEAGDSGEDGAADAEGDYDAAWWGWVYAVMMFIHFMTWSDFYVFYYIIIFIIGKIRDKF
jgi:hypothetical protein